MSHYGIQVPDQLVTLRMHGISKVISADIHDNKVVIIRQYPSNRTYSNGRPAPDEVIKQVYGVVDGKIVLEKEVTGTHTPAHHVQETVEFSE